MKQKMLGGAALVMTASVNSFAGSCPKGNEDNKVDLSKVTDLGKLGDLEIGKGDKKLIKDFKKDGNNEAKILDEIKKITDTSADKVIYNDTVDGGLKEGLKGHYLKVAVKDNKIDNTPTAMAKDATIDAGCYFFVTIPESNKIKIEIKNVKGKIQNYR